MANFEFTIIDIENVIHRGYIRAWSKKNASKQIRQQGTSIVTLTKVRHRAFHWRNIFRYVSRIDRIVFLRNLMTMMRAGLNLPEALASSREQSSNPAMKRLIAEAESAVLAGQTLSSALARHGKVFTPVTIAMIHIGERGGKLVESLEFLVKQQEGDYNLLRRIRNSLVYPAAIIATMIAIVVVMMLYVIPKIAAIYEEVSAPLPFFTSALIAVSSFIAGNGLLLALGIIIIIFLWRYFIKTSPRFKKFMHRLILHTPIFGLVVKKLNLAMVSRSLHLLTYAGFSIDEGVYLASNVAGNVYYREALQEAVPFIKRGVQLSDIFKGRPKLFLPLFRKMLTTGEETGSIDEMFAHIAKYYDEDIQHWSANLSSLIEPILLLLTGVIVGGVTFSIIYPLWNFANIL